MAANFVAEDNGQFFMVRCPVCKSENYGPAVASGQCAWCGATAVSAIKKWGDEVKTNRLHDFMMVTQGDLDRLLTDLDVTGEAADHG